MRLIVTGGLEPEEADEYGVVDDDDADSYKEDGSGSVEEGLSTDVTEAVTKEVE